MNTAQRNFFLFVPTLFLLPFSPYQYYVENFYRVKIVFSLYIKWMTNSSSVVLERTMNNETVCLLNMAVSVLIDKGHITTLIISEHERVGKIQTASFI